MYSRILCERHYGSITFLESRDVWESLMKLAKNIDHTTYVLTIQLSVKLTQKYDNLAKNFAINLLSDI